MKIEKKETYCLVAFGVVLFAVLMNFGPVLGAVKTVLGYFAPFFVGVIIAFVLAVPCKGFTKLLTKAFPKAKQAAVATLSVVLTFVALAAVLVVLSVIVVPVVGDSAKAAYAGVKQSLPGWIQALEERNLDATSLRNLLARLDLEEFLGKLSENADDVFATLLGAASGTITRVVTFATGLIIALYILMDRERVLSHSKKLLQAMLGEERSGKVFRFARMLSASYAKFLSGQCIEALILGVLMFAVLAVAGIPYAAMVAVLSAVFSFVPYIGSFLACAIGVVLMLVTAPQKVVLLIILYVAVQFVEEQFIYPKVVGTSVGLSPLLTFVSVIIGGSLFGLLGMIFFLPLVSVLYTLVSEWVKKKTGKQKEVLASDEKVC